MRRSKTKTRIFIIIVILVLLITEGLFVVAGKLQARREKHENSSPAIDVDSIDADNTDINNVNSDDEGVNTDGIGETIDTNLYPDSYHLTFGLHGTNPTLVKEGEPYIESGAFCIDDRVGIIKDVTIEGDVDTSVPGDYKISYVFSGDNARKSITRTVRVVSSQNFDAKIDGVPVFMYHYVYTNDDVPETLNGNYILDSDLEEQLIWLKDNDYYFPSFAELRAFVDGEISLPQKSCILTFDDGQKGFLKYGIPLLEKYEIPATSFLIGIKDATGIMTKNASPYVSFESHSYDMHRAGGTIGHGGVISALSQDEILSDLKAAIDIFGSSAAFAYPYGDYTDEAVTAISEAGILCAFTTEYDWVHVGDNPALLPRVRIVGDAGLDAFIGSM